jgi:predicted DNA-binding protein
MSVTLTVRLPEEIAEWLKDSAKRTGMPVNRIVREHLERAKEQQSDKLYLRFAGRLKGLPRDLSTRKGYSTR